MKMFNSIERNWIIYGPSDIALGGACDSSYDVTTQDGHAFPITGAFTTLP